jgi:hypothetical protein
MVGTNDGQPITVSMATVQRVWRDNGLKPHLVKTFKVPTTNIC